MLSSPELTKQQKVQRIVVKRIIYACNSYTTVKIHVNMKDDI